MRAYTSILRDVYEQDGDLWHQGWSQKDFAMLKSEYGVTPNDVLARRLGRTVRAIQEFARRHGVSAIANRHRPAQSSFLTDETNEERQAA